MLKQNPQFPEGINASAENPLKEFATLVIGLGILLIVTVFTLGVLANWLAPYIPFAWERSVVANAAFFNDRTAFDEPHQDAQQALIELGESLVSRAELDPAMVVQFHLLEEDVPNAFATLGGQIFVTRGLLQAVTSENALAMVVAHEIAHIKYRHPIQTLTRGALISLVYSAVMGGSGTSDAQALLGQAGWLTALSFNRDMEKSADDFAIFMLQRQYGHLLGAADFFQNMLDKNDQPTWLVFLQTHPHSRERLQRIKFAAASGDNPNPTVTALDTRIQAYLSSLE